MTESLPFFYFQRVRSNATNESRNPVLLTRSLDSPLALLASLGSLVVPSRCKEGVIACILRLAPSSLAQDDKGSIPLRLKRIVACLALGKARKDKRDLGFVISNAIERRRNCALFFSRNSYHATRTSPCLLYFRS